MPVEEPSAAGRRLRFEILGPLRAWRGDRELSLGPAKQRAVLAVLLVNANKPIKTTQIVDAVWRDDPPENGANVVQKYVAGLRRVVEPDRQPHAPGQVLTLTDAGYLLRIEAGHLDADVFTDLVRQARGAWTEGRLGEAAQALRSAIALWRTEALAGLSGPLFDSLRTRLAEDRGAALEMWAAIELELGHHEQLVPELFRLVTEFPLREPLRYLLVLGLYRAGRQAEALAAYEDTRRFLAEELGTEPGDRLQQLHLRILRSDPSLLASGVATPASVGPLSPARNQAPSATVPSGPRAPARGRPRSRLGGLAPVVLPLASLGLLTWVVFVYLAGRYRSTVLALASAGYLMIVIASVLAFTPEGTTTRDVIAMLGLLVAMCGGAAHAALVTSGRDRNALLRMSHALVPAAPSRSRWRPWLSRLAAIAVPMASLGLLSWAVIACFAVSRRSLAAGLSAAAYFVLAAVFTIRASAAGPSDVDLIAMLALILALCGGTAHAAVLSFGRRR